MYEFYKLDGIYYCLKSSEGCFKSADSIIEIDNNVIKRVNFSDLENEVKKGGSEYSFTMPFVSKFNHVQMSGECIGKSEFYKKAYFVLGLS
tara:strand:- start:372 stop:644 length:273 start_codon:yes stop_codon:yes gene_type:complete